MRTSGEEAVHIDMLALPIAPDTSSSLLVVCRVPVGVKEDEPVGTDQVEAAASRLAAEQEHKVALICVIEVLYLHIHNH